MDKLLQEVMEKVNKDLNELKSKVDIDKLISDLRLIKKTILSVNHELSDPRLNPEQSQYCFCNKFSIFCNEITPLLDNLPSWLIIFKNYFPKGEK